MFMSVILPCFDLCMSNSFHVHRYLCIADTVCVLSVLDMMVAQFS